VVVTRKKIPAGDVPDNVVGEHVHESGRIATLLRLRKAADDFDVLVLSSAYHCTNIGITTCT